MSRRVTLYRGIRAKAEQRDEIVRAHMQGELGPYAGSGSVYLFHRLPGNERTRLMMLKDLTLRLFGLGRRGTLRRASGHGRG